MLGDGLSVIAEYRKPNTENRKLHTDLFKCAIGGGDGILVDPYGNTFPCELIRKPVFNLLRFEVHDARERLLRLVRNRQFTIDSKCKYCRLREICHWCPGRAYLEKGDIEAPIPYYCELAKLAYIRQSAVHR